MTPAPQITPLPLAAATLDRLPPAIRRPAYDRARLSPGILHVGVGNFHRAHQAVYLDDLFGLGRDHDWAIVGAGLMPGDARQRALAVAERRQRPHWRWQTMTLPAAAAVAIAVVAMTLLLDDGGFRRASQAVVAAPPEAVPDLDLLTSGENLELLDDLEFFRWLPPARRS